jgi:hypothetical protein
MDDARWTKVIRGHYTAEINGCKLAVFRGHGGKRAWWHIFLDGKEVSIASTLVSAKRRAIARVASTKPVLRCSICKVRTPRGRYEWLVSPPRGYRFLDGSHELVAHDETEASDHASSPIEPCPEDCPCGEEESK